VLRICDPVHVHVDALAAIGLAPFERQPARVVAHHRLGQRAGEAVHVGEARAALGHGDALDPVRVVVGHSLHEEAVLVDALRERLDRERTVAHVGQHRGRDALVVASEVELRDPGPRKQHLVRVRDRHAAASDA
jgi:hypothetical protein